MDKVENYNIKIKCESENIELDYSSVIGKHSLHEDINDNERRLIDVANARRMGTSSRRFRHKKYSSS